MNSKKISLLFVMFLLAFGAMAQSPLGKGGSQLNAGVGFSNWGLPVYVGLDFGVHPDITLGGELSFRSYGENYNKVKYNHTLIGIYGNANYHFNSILQIPRNWDLYLGLNVGFVIWNSPSDYDGSHNSGLGLGAQLGTRYYFTNRFGLNLELGGLGFNGGKFGISYKL
ncbi:MAG: hypothetical protein RIS47_2009 [Bacteroidota bacterium]|jgi:hypothetical protein